MADIEHFREAVLGIKTQQEFADLVGVTQATVCRWENGETLISPLNAIKIESATGGKITKSDLRPDLWPSPSQEDGRAA